MIASPIPQSSLIFLSPSSEMTLKETLLSRSWKKTVMFPRRLRETGGSNRVAHTGYFAQSNLSNYVFRVSHSDRFSRSLLRRTLSRNFILPCFLQRKPPDWQDFVGIITLLFINSTISFIEENNAGNAAAALMACLAPKAKVLCDGKWSGEDVVVLIPGDVVNIKLGDIIPVDVRLFEGDPLKIDQVLVTIIILLIEVGESFPVTKSPRDGVYSGSTCKQGEIEAVVIATSVHTFFGKAAHLVDSTNHVFARGVDGEAVVLMAARASRVENQDAIDAAIVGTLANPKEARAGIQEVHFLPFNPTDKRTALTYIDGEGKMHRVSRDALEQCAVRFAGSATILCLDPYSIYRLLRIDGLGVGVFLLLALRISVPKVDSWEGRESPDLHCRKQKP
ncbi:hypothetical protein TEA_022124 [Camellia sinensis var. sinensis]|uniref:P-type ATPase A domain-containing protein n=1 Tax=Camellia sinensis var. sinensis TaxID=542762 RepID=A0A4S4D903_CAMSN|nr:hypothetical protein TEA_022124 [Camellia sinensis var. sinensis]